MELLFIFSFGNLIVAAQTETYNICQEIRVAEKNVEKPLGLPNVWPPDGNSNLFIVIIGDRFYTFRIICIRSLSHSIGKSPVTPLAFLEIYIHQLP